MAELELLSDLHQEVWSLDFIIEAGSDDGDVVAPSLAAEGWGCRSRCLGREEAEVNGIGEDSRRSVALHQRASLEELGFGTADGDVAEGLLCEESLLPKSRP